MSHAITAVIPVQEEPGTGVLELHDKYEAALQEPTNGELEFIYIVNPDLDNTRDTLLELSKERTNVRMIELARSFGEATALNIGASNAKYDLIMTLPSVEQVKIESLGSLVAEIEDHDVVLAKRSDRTDSGLRQLPSKTLNAIVNKFSDAPFSDASCGVRVFRKQVLDEINLYGDLHRFMSMLAYEQGFKIKLVDMPQAETDRTSFSSPVLYLRHLLDVLTVIFLTRFNKRPLRFFGSIGTTSLLIGSAGMAFIAFQRMVMDVSAADRPLLVLFVLAAALGIQLIAIGLVGESLIFTHAREIKEYKIREIHSK